MNPDRSEGSGAQIETVQTEPECRKPWSPPVLSQLRAGTAENIRGSAFVDGPLETIGS